MSKNIKLMQGNEACVAGAIYAGMKFYGGYPITPSTEIAEKSAELLPTVGGKFIQMEDEIAGIAAAIGGSLTGKKSMTATSGPGFSLKQENIGYAMIAEIPLVIVNVQRGGPSTGLPTAPAQGEIMQAKWGTHGDHPVIAISPSTVRETFDLTVRAFNLAEKYRTPVMLLTDEIVGHMREKIEIPEPGELEVFDRLEPVEGEAYSPYGVREGDIVPRMAAFGSGHRYHVTGLFHDETGFPSNSTKNAGFMLDRMMNKVENNLDDIIEYEEYMLDDAEVCILSYGSSARAAKTAIAQLREEGIKAGLFRAITIWPFAEKRVKALAEQFDNIVVAELNLGQYVYEVDRVVQGAAKVSHVGKANGEVLTPAEIAAKVKEVM
jgi:2-oxoglutarate ferredoxin oxidoreductase subunit alpha